MSEQDKLFEKLNALVDSIHNQACAIQNLAEAVHRLVDAQVEDQEDDGEPATYLDGRPIDGKS